MSTVTTLDPMKVTITCANRYLTGFAADGIFTITWNAARTQLVVGTQGDGVYVESANESANLTVTLSPTSSSISFLEELCAQRTKFPVTINDATEDARLTYYSDNCRVEKFADKSRNMNAPTTSYVVIMPAVVKVA